MSAFSTAALGLALAYPGTPTTQVELNDGGVWVTNAALSLLGHLNFQAGELDSSLRATSNTFDVLQREGAVILDDAGSGTASTVDVANVTLTHSTPMPADAVLVLGGQVVAITATDTTETDTTATTNLWVLPADQVASFDAEQMQPTATFDTRVAVSVGGDGTAWAAVAATGELHRFPVGGGSEVRSLPGTPTDSELEVTTVGTHVVVLDATVGTVSVDGGEPIAVDGAKDARLQQPGPDAAAVEVATNDALLDVPLGGGEPVRHGAGGDGVPAAPVRLNGCTYAAWSGAARYVRDCDGTAYDSALDVPNAGDGELRFRVNRDVVVLNNVTTGAVWLTDNELTPVNNWSDVTPPEDDENEDESAGTSEDQALPDRTKANQDPVAVEDHFGVRPGRTAVLPVLANDSDPEGDVLVAQPKTQPTFGALESIRDGEAFQLAVPADATGSSSFTYTALDGRGGQADADVSLEVHGWDTEAAPTQDRISTLVVEQGKSATMNVLPGWSDPDGDDIFLQTVGSTTDDQVRSTPDGQVTFTDVGTSSGRKKVVLVVSDGQKTTTGELTIEVRSPGAQPPVANADHVGTVVGRTVTVSPLANDTDANGDQLRLAKVEERSDLQVTEDFTAGTFTVTAQTAGTYYLTYVVTDGPATAAGLVRIDVADAGTAQGAPIAVRDTAMLTAGGKVYVDPLANDVDPAGGVLVVQGVTLPADSPLTVAVLDHHLLRISAQSALTGPASFTYAVSNGTASATGEVVVLPVPATATTQPPVALDDTATVRVGDVVSIPVLANDTSPSGAVLSVVHELAQQPESGTAFVATDRVRFQAPDTATTVHLIYEVTDSAQQTASAQVTITVRAADTEHNSPPQPADVTARALAGQTIRIPVTLDGIDPDGDSVQLVGIGSAPTKGRVVTTGESWLDYEANKDGAGTDTFTYTVEDRFGGRASASVLVGIAPAAATNQQPVAVPDTVTARPGRDLAVPVVANDVDADGDPLTLVQGSLEVSDSSVEAKVSGDRVELATPSEAGVLTVYYGVTDSKTGTVTGSLTVTVDPNAPLQAPIARDDLLTAAQVTGETSTTVKVLDNDEDLDGSVAELQIASPVEGVTVDPDGSLRVPVTATGQAILYTVTDVDGLIGSAFVWVPGTGDERPRLKSTEPVMVDSGATVTLKLADYVQVAAGKSPRITTAASVTALQGDGSPVLVDETTLSFTSAAGYFGPAGVSFEVTDGTGPEDPNGRTAVLTIPITVNPAANQQPTFTGSTVEVAPGEDAVAVDLVALTTDPDAGDLTTMRYALEGQPAEGLQVSVSGQRLIASAGVDVPKGTTATIKLTISDGTTAPVDGSLTLSVIASTRPLAVANDDVVDKAQQGKPVTVDVLANDQNPFPAAALTLVGSPVVETGTGAASLSGSQVQVTPAKDFIGTMVVRYRVQDASKDVGREVDGRIRLTVEGRPATPATPQVSEVRSKTVVLTWAAPANNGAPITGYTVRSSGGPTFSCPTTTCTLEGLTNNLEYTFSVVATNEVGDSDPSPVSAPARPDAKPSAPGVPVLTFGDTSLDVTWAAPTGYEGSPVESYTLEISPPASGGGQRTGITGTSYTWTGLENGVPYQVRVQAINRAPDPSDWSGYSASEIPAGVPDAPAQPTTTRLDPVGSQAQLQVAWVAPQDNGDAIASYTVNVLRGGAAVSSIKVAGGTTTQAITLGTSESDYSFTVTAANKAGNSAASAASAPRRAFVAPGAVSSLTAAPGDNVVTVSYGPAAGNGAAASEIAYQYQVNGGAWIAMPGDKVIRSGVGNNGTYTIGVRASTTLDGVTYPGAATDSDAVAPFGPPGQPGVSASGNDTTVTLNWSPPSRNGRDFQVQISVDGGGWQSVASSGSTQAGNGHSETHSIRARAVDTENQTSSEVSASATSAAPPPPPPPSAWVTKGSAASNVCSGSCNYMVVNVQNIAAGRYTVRFWSDDGGTDAVFYTLTMNLASSGSYGTNVYYGFPNNSAWFEVVGQVTSSRQLWRDVG
ncbi:fibronectin type III domain-containing protein [Pengzhenrongella sicca]|uniref:Tandem-95 repeat protein n=1 Tax=Pengzhenrongella sicca TaxID=2819238 RepID=A0A8A4ZES5_9MICO|nr:fibronectin type III domain-containing protein [Pengzhenrongella sicca]QTE28997.1 tandem-95 repeat protein [Pengzhenrongella sicca]